jgi:hypothetical protein
VQTIKFFSPLLLLVFFSSKNENIQSRRELRKRSSLEKKIIIYSSHKKLVRISKRREGNQPARVKEEEGESALSWCEIS